VVLTFFESCEIEEYFWSINKLSDINKQYLATVNDSEIVVECFEESSVKLDRSLLKEDDEVLVIYIANNEGDGGIFDGYIGNGEYGEINYDILNVNGGAIALGHPVGMSGARILIHALRELKRRGKNRALVSICIGGGQGGACVVEVN
jgi:hypothetical protein